MRIAFALLVLLNLGQPCQAWWEAGHQIISLLAYDLMTNDEQQELQDLLQAHPRLAEDFISPAPIAKSDDQKRWLIGRAAYWPDVARSVPEYNRPNWHYQLGSVLTIGEVKNVPPHPGPLPSEATLETADLHIAQAVELCRRVLRDKAASKSNRALSVCWLAHLVGDAHQPCHAGSLYMAGVFPEGDRGANLIPTRQAKNLHALWDSLLGDRYDAGDIRRRCNAIRSEESTWAKGQKASQQQDGLNPMAWLAESAELARMSVYTPEVLQTLDAAARKLTAKVETIDLSEAYLTEAGHLARTRATFAAHRLSAIWKADLK